MDQPYQPETLDTALIAELQRGERVLWQGRATGRFRPALMGIWLFAIPWTAFAIFWTLMTGAMQAVTSDSGDWFDWIFPLFGVPFILIGIGMLAAPFLAPRKAKRTIFAITEQRVLRLYRGRTLQVQSVPLDRVGSMERIENADGSGTIRIALSISTDSDGTRTTDYFTLGEVANVRMVEARLRELKRYAERNAVSSSASSRS